MTSEFSVNSCFRSSFSKRNVRVLKFPRVLFDSEFQLWIEAVEIIKELIIFFFATSIVRIVNIETEKHLGIVSEGDG